MKQQSFDQNFLVRLVSWNQSSDEFNPTGKWASSPRVVFVVFTFILHRSVPNNSGSLKVLWLRETNGFSVQHFFVYSKIGCRRTLVFKGQVGCSYFQAAFLPRSTTYIAESNRPKSQKHMMFLVQAGTFLCFQAGRSSATRSSASDLTVLNHNFKNITDRQDHDFCSRLGLFTTGRILS